MSRLLKLTGWAVFTVIVFSGGFAAGATFPFREDGTNGFTFDTGLLKGRLRVGGQSKGLTSVIHSPTGMRVDRGMGLLGHYRLFANGRRYEDGWSVSSKGSLQPDGSVEVTWQPSTNRPFELKALYRIVSSNEVEVTTMVTAHEKLAGFESFLASYFGPEFTNALVLVRDSNKPGGGKFLAADQKYGDWLVFSRDRAAMQIVRDGRWAIPPNPVDWAEMPHFAAPFAIRRAPVPWLSAAVMSNPQNCFAVLTPHESETHYSVYLSQFGRTIQPGETQSNNAKLGILQKASEAEMQQLYDTWIDKQ